MTLHPSQIRTKLLSFLASTLFVSVTSLASMSEEAYRSALQIADKKALRKSKALGETQALRTGTHAQVAANSSESNTQALSSSTVRKLFGRYYQVGDSWDVTAWQFNHAAMRMTGDPTQLGSQIGHGGMFHYEVVNIKAGLSPQVTLRITQLQSNEFKETDPKVNHLTLIMNDHLVQSEKVYFFKGNDKGVPVSPDGIHSRITPLEFFPLDIPEILTAEQKAPSFPSLPPTVKDYANRIGFKPDLSRSLWFEQDDFFGRPIQILWQQGDPWPSYFRTTGGIAILTHKGTL